MKVDDNVFPKVIVSEVTATATPAAATVVVYAKADGLLYSKDDAGVETLVSGGTGGGGSSLTVQDEGSSLATAATTVNFTGAGVTASGTGATKTVNIPGGGGTFVGASVYNSANQTITGGGSGTAVLFDSEHFDTDAFHSTASNTGRLTIPSGGGNYFAVFNGALAAADGDGAANVQIHGVFGGSDLIVAAVPITGLTLLNVTTPIIDFAAGDYLYVVIFTGSNRTLSFASRYSPEFSIAKL
jgi:hypothetical protein